MRPAVRVYLKPYDVVNADTEYKWCAVRCKALFTALGLSAQPVEQKVWWGDEDRYRVFIENVGSRNVSAVFYVRDWYIDYESSVHKEAIAYLVQDEVQDMVVKHPCRRKAVLATKGLL